MGFLDEIVHSTLATIEGHKRKRHLMDLKQRIRDNEPSRDFSSAIAKHDGVQPNLIAEIKKSSPSKGLLRSTFNLKDIATVYEENGAAAISVLTEEHFFQGQLEHVKMVRDTVKLPVLRKDFMLLDYQIFEARAFDADAILLIVSLLDDFQLRDFSEIAQGLGMSCLAEIHTQEELVRTIKLNLRNIGINNRDLMTFETELGVTYELIKEIPRNRTIVAESGISDRKDIDQLKEAGVNAVLIGESFMRSDHIEMKIRELFG